MRLWKLVVDIFEPSVGFEYPVVRHEFYGRTKKEAEGYYQAHLTTDAFLRGCVEKKRWKRVQCETDAFWEQVS